MPPVSAMVRLTACSRPRALAGTTSKVDVAKEPRDKPLAMPRNEMSTASWKKFWANGISKKAIAGIPVLGTVAHFLPTLSMTKPAGKNHREHRCAGNREEHPHFFGRESEGGIREQRQHALGRHPMDEARQCGEDQDDVGRPKLGMYLMKQLAQPAQLLPKRGDSPAGY